VRLMIPDRVIENLQEKLSVRLKLKQKFATIIEGSWGVYNNLAHVFLALDNVKAAHDNYIKSVNCILMAPQPIMKLIPNVVKSPSSDWPWVLYYSLYGLSPEKIIEHFKLIINETENAEGKQLDVITIESYLTIIPIMIIAYLINDSERLDKYLFQIFSQTEKYSNGNMEELTQKRTDDEKFVFLYTRARGYMIKGLKNNDPSLVKQGLKLATDIHKKFVKKTDNPESIADPHLIICYDQAKSKWPDFYLETPFIPKSILEKGYWNQITKAA